MKGTPCECDGTQARWKKPHPSPTRLSEREFQIGLRNFDEKFWPPDWPFPPTAPYLASLYTRAVLRKAYVDEVIDSVSDAMFVALILNRGTNLR